MRGVLLLVAFSPWAALNTSLFTPYSFIHSCFARDRRRPVAVFAAPGARVIRSITTRVDDASFESSKTQTQRARKYVAVSAPLQHLHALQLHSVLKMSDPVGVTGVC